MAGEKSTQTGQSEVDELAFRIFSHRIANLYGRRGNEQLAVDAYRKAEAFLAVRDKVRKGELEIDKPDGPVLSDCCAPNLKPTHPFNLVSQRMGSLPKVRLILTWIETYRKNCKPDTPPEELLVKLNREFPELGWDESAVNTARNIFPAYCNNN